MVRERAGRARCRLRTKALRGQDPGQARGQHRFARPRRADHQQVVTASGGDFKGAFRAFLSFDIRQIAATAAGSDLTRRGGGEGALSGVVAHHLIQRASG